ncbi:MAG: pilus assembly protein [Atopobiaceae bacterium]|nr:pilus assembly protein [Atopobiaceae bacterium]
MACRVRGRLALRRTSCSIEQRPSIGSLARQRGQSSVEAAVLLPTLMLLLGILIQPAFLLYTRMVMRSVAGECARVLLTASKEDEDACRRFALRRLDAVPNASPFHVGGRDGWEVTFDYAEDGSSVSVDIVGRLRPLPLLGVATAALGERDGDLLVLRTHVTERLRPSWFGGSYGSWQQVWG